MRIKNIVGYRSCHCWVLWLLMRVLRRVSGEMVVFAPESIQGMELPIYVRWSQFGEQEFTNVTLEIVLGRADICEVSSSSQKYNGRIVALYTEGTGEMADLAVSDGKRAFGGYAEGNCKGGFDAGDTDVSTYDRWKINLEQNVLGELI